MKEKVTILAFLIIIFGCSFLGIVLPKKEISLFERRKTMSCEKLKEDFFENLDDYLSDHFPFRETLISLNNFTEREIFNNSSANDVFVENGYLIEKNYPLNEKSLDSFIKKLAYINDNYLQNSDVYYTLIPDKSYFLEEGVRIDFDLIKEKIKELNIDYIDAFEVFERDDYYKTDIHIKQPAYLKFISEAAKEMHFDSEEIKYKENRSSNFYGASYSKVAYVKPDDLVYLTNEMTDASKVQHLEYGVKRVYNETALNGIDAYNVFLDGPSALLEIETASPSDKEILIFRDSFASSMAPLLIPYYKKITLIDLRYISFEQALSHVSFDNKSVLFMYSTLMANKSDLLKVTVK